MKSRMFILILLGVILLPSIVLSQVNDSLLALEYYNKATSFRMARIQHLTPEQKTDSSFHYYMLAFPLLHKAHLWKELISSSHHIAKYKKDHNEKDVTGFLFKLIDTLKYYKVNHKIENIYIQLAALDRENKTKYYNTALGIVTERGDSASTARFLKLLGDWYTQQDSTDQAINYYKRALEIRKQTKLSLDEIYSVISKLYKFTCDYGIALQYLDSAFTQTDNITNRATYINDMGSVYNQMGDFEKALEYAERAIKLQMTSKDKVYHKLMTFYSNIATILNYKGDYQKSNEYLEEAISLIEKQGLRTKVLCVILHLKSLNYLQLNKPKNAMDCLPLFNITLKKFNQDTSVVLDLYGRIYYKSGDYDSSLAYFNLAGASKYNYTDLGDLYFKLNKFEKSREFYNKKISALFSGKEKVHPFSILLIKKIGDTYFAEGKIDSALIYYNSVLKMSGIDTTHSNEQILEIVERKDIDMIIFEVFLQLARIHKIYYDKNNNLQELKDSHEDFILASELLNNYKLLLESEKSKFFWSEKTSEFFDEAVNNALFCVSKFYEQKYLNDAFKLMELSKGHILQGSINETAAIKMSDIPDSLRIVEQNFRDKLNSVKLFRRKELQEENPNLHKISYLDNEIFTLKRDYSYLIKDFEQQYPEYYRLKYETNIISITELQRKLNIDESVLQYYLGRNQLNVIIINKDSVYSYRSQIDSVFHSSIQRFLGQLIKGNLIRNKKRSEFIELSNYLYKILFEPISEYISSKKELIVIPGGKLLSLPFEVLISEKSAETSFNSQRFLIRDYVISYQYSATLGFDPKYQKIAAWKDCFTGFAPSFDQNMKVFGRKSMSELLFNEAEVKQISDLFQHQNKKAQIFTGSSATESRFKSLEACRYIHIATHSIANEENPELSALYFSNTPNDTTQDNILYADELFNVKLNAELIVLSSCETGAGKIVNGEGIIALTRGLIYNGIPNLLFSLWEVSDRSTSMLMVEFYKNILMGKSYKMALRDSKLKMLSNDFTSFPDKWGAFVLIGN